MIEKLTIEISEISKEMAIKTYEQDEKLDEIKTNTSTAVKYTGEANKELEKTKDRHSRNFRRMCCLVWIPFFFF